VHSIPGSEEKTENVARKVGMFGLALESTFLSFARGKHACSAPDTIHHGCCTRELLFTITSGPPAGSRGPVAVSAYP
jgi:hypothetical protein